MHRNFHNVNDAFRGLVKLFHGPGNGLPGDRLGLVLHSSSRNGNVLMIDEPVTVTYYHPKERVLFNAARDANPFFHLYESLWMLAGRNDVAPLAYYAKQMREYSDDGGTLNGAYGYRWRQHRNIEWDSSPEGSQRTRYDQLEIIINHLKNHPTSRRAVLQMWNVEDDLLKIEDHPERSGNFYNPDLKLPASKDVCCNLSVMFSIRQVESNGANPLHPDWKVTERFLDMTVTNRSNDMIWGMLGANYVHFSILQEYIAAHIGVEVGRYNHFTNNLHVYEWNWKPGEWLADETRGYYVHEYSTFPLIRDPEIFDLELPLVVNHFDGNTKTNQRIDGLVEPFFRNVAAPMLRAFQLYKHGELETALRMCRLVQADDWRVAAEGWIKRRIERVQSK